MFCYTAVVWFMWWLGDVLLCHVIHMCVKSVYITAECFVLFWVSMAVSNILIYKDWSVLEEWSLTDAVSDPRTEFSATELWKPQNSDITWYLDG